MGKACTLDQSCLIAPDCSFSTVLADQTLPVPNLNSLRTFDAAARHLNFRLAAEELHVTQGAVAQQVRRLEAELGLKLFDRKARGLALTDVGRAYFVPVSRALTTIDEATLKLRPQSAQVRLSVTPSFASKWLVPRLGAFERDHPDIDLQVLASEGLADFRSDGIDLAVRQGQPPFGDDLKTELLANLELFAVCSPSYAKNVDPVGQVGDFITHRLIQDGHNHWDRLLDEAGSTAPYRKMQFNQAALAMDAAANGQGVALVPHLLARADIDQGTLVALWRDLRADQHGYYIVRPRGRKPKAVIQCVIDWLLQEIGHI